MDSKRGRIPFEPRSVGLFLVVAFGVSWAYNAVYDAAFAATFAGTTLGRITPHFSAWGPLLAAGFVVWRSSLDVREWFGSLVRLRESPHLYLLAFVVPNAVSSAAMVVFPIHGVALELSASPVNFVLVFVFTLVLLGALEEFGWRGFLQPTLQRRTSATMAAVVVGAVWSVWHLPSFLAGYLGDMNFALFFVHLLAMSVVMAWLYNRAVGLLPVMVFHAAHNAPGNAFATVGEAPEAVASLYYPVYTGLWILVAVGFVAVAGVELGGETDGSPVSR